MWKVTTKKEKASSEVLTKNFVHDDDGCLWVYGQDEKEAVRQSQFILKCSDVTVTRVSNKYRHYYRNNTLYLTKMPAWRGFSLSAVCTYQVSFVCF